MVPNPLDLQNPSGTPNAPSDNCRRLGQVVVVVAVGARHRDGVVPLLGRHRRLPPDDLVLALATPVFLEQGRLQPPRVGDLPFMILISSILK